MEENKTEIAEVKEISPIEEAKKILEEIKLANAEKKALLDREEKIRVSEMLKGRAEAGAVPKKIDPDEEKFQEKWLQIKAAVGR